MELIFVGVIISSFLFGFLTYSSLQKFVLIIISTICIIIWMVLFTRGPVITETSVITNCVEIYSHKIMVDKPVKFITMDYSYRGLIFNDYTKYAIVTNWSENK